MQHQDRQKFVAQIAQLIDDARDQPRDPGRATPLEARIHSLLDQFLLESQAIVPVEATILIADIRGFTSLTQAYPPRVMIAALNRYFQVMGALIKHHGGAIDKFMGDAVLALFGVPVARPDDLARALTCAVEMQRAMLALNRVGVARGEPRLYAGIAVNTGDVMAGSFGSRVHNEYTVIGDAVNLAARMEGFSLRGQILLSASSHAAARAYIDVGSVNDVMVKGKTQPIRLYELLAITGPRRLEVPEVDIRKTPRVKVSLPLNLWRVESKRIAREPFQGQANDLGYYGMNADLPLILPPHCEVLIQLFPTPGVPTESELYARVLRSHPIGSLHRTNLSFTSIDTPEHRQVKHYVDQLLWHR